MMRILMLVALSLIGSSVASPLGEKLEDLLDLLQENKQDECGFVNPLSGPDASASGDTSVFSDGSCGHKYGNKAAVLQEIKAWLSNDGGSQILDKILGGNNAKVNEWPWMVSVQNAGRGRGTGLHRCGGSLIHKQWVLTAASCLFPSGVSQTFDTCSIQVEVAEFSLSTRDDRGHSANVTDVVVHPDFDAGSLSNNVALIKLAAEENLNRRGWLTKVCLDSGAPSYGSAAVVTGWGSKNGSSPDSTVRFLQEAEVAVMKESHCGGATVEEGEICAGDLGSNAVCEKDVGGPLFSKQSDGNYTQIGIVSHTSCDKNGYGVYTKVSHYHDWIASVISQH